MKNGELFLVASSLSFSTILALVPFILVTLSIFKMVGGLDILYPKVHAMVLSYLKEAAGVEVSTFIKKTIDRINMAAIGKTGAVALALTSIRLIYGIEYGVNRVWNIVNKRSVLKRAFINFGLLTLFILSLAIYAGFRSVKTFKPFFRSDVAFLSDWFVATVGILLIYKILPAVKVNTKYALFTSMLTSIIILFIGGSFAILGKSFFTYSKIYGGLATIPLMSVLILVLWNVILFGLIICKMLHRNQEFIIEQ